MKNARDGRKQVLDRDVGNNERCLLDSGDTGTGARCNGHCERGERETLGGGEEEGEVSSLETRDKRRGEPEKSRAARMQILWG